MKRQKGSAWWLHPSSSRSIRVKDSLISIITAFIAILLLSGIFSALYSIAPAQSTLQTTTIASSPPLTANLLWNYTHVNDIFHRPIVVNGIVYVNAQVDSCVAAINAETGVEIWYHHSGSNLSTFSSLAVANDIAYINSQGMFWALNTLDGTELWRYPIGSDSSPTVVDGVVYVGSTISDEGQTEGSVVALDAINGTKLWHVPLGNQLYSAMSSPAVVDGVVYIGASDNNVYALSAKNGETLWHFTTGASVISSPTVVDGKVYIGSNDHNIYALNATSGEKFWSYKTGDVVLSSPVVVDSIVYIGSSDCNAYALDASNGGKLWNYTTGGRVDVTPTVANGVMYISSHDGGLYCLNAFNGEKLWSIYTELFFGSPTAVDDIVYVAAFPSLYAFSTIAVSSASHTPLYSIIIGVIAISIVGTIVIRRHLKIREC
ncbi:MAG: PQQ-binding-like beta-propeller repeat protein [Nitrososphaerota archaeon]|jgi:outer membrane protein assembly factor BamB|nr:PQQ-binding-like beta-propeller repeat protein [Nitrososphaerota archaeon]